MGTCCSANPGDQNELNDDNVKIEPATGVTELKPIRKDENYEIEESAALTVQRYYRGLLTRR